MAAPPYRPAELQAWLSPSQWARTAALQRAAVDWRLSQGPGWLEVEGLFPRHGRALSRFTWREGKPSGHCPCKPSGACAHVGALALLGLQAWKAEHQGAARAWEAQLAAWLPKEAPAPRLRLAWGPGRPPSLALGLGPRFTPLPWASWRPAAEAPEAHRALHAFLQGQALPGRPPLELPLPGPDLSACLLALAGWALEDEAGRPLQLRWDAGFEARLEARWRPDGGASLRPQLQGPEGPLGEDEALELLGEAPWLWAHHRGLIARCSPSAGLAMAQRKGLEVPPEGAARLRAQLQRLDAAGLLAPTAEAPGAVEVGLTLEPEAGGWRLRPRLKAGGMQASPRALLAALRQGQPKVRLEDGREARLPEAWAARLGALLRAAPPAPGDAWRVPGHRLDLLAEAWGAPGERAAPPALADRLEAWAAAEGRGGGHLEAIPRSPAGFQGELRPYQLQGLAFLRGLRALGLGGLLADDMGLGKTAQAIALLAERQDGEPPDLVLAPSSVLPNWQAELARFAPGLRVQLHHGPKRSPEAWAQADLVLSSHALARQDREAFLAQGWRHVVLDEAQAIKSASAQLSLALQGLKSQHRWALSGTPVENHLGELWSLFHFLLPELLGPMEAFQAEFLTPMQDPDQRGAAMEALRRRVGPFLLRRRKAEVAPELPPRIEQLHRCELLPGQAEAYEALRQGGRALLKSPGQGAQAWRMQALAALTRLRQACCHPSLVPGLEEEGLPSAKLALALELMELLRAEGHRCLVFSQFTGFLALLRQEVEARGWTHRYLDGATRERGAEVAAFQAGEADFFLLSLKAGGVGLNLTAADHVLLLDPWWNPAVEAQAGDRAHRIGQERPVVVHRLIAQGTVEEGLLALQAHKQGLSEALLEGPGGGDRLGEAELLALLEGA